MANPYKAEIEAEIGGITRRLRLRANELVEIQTHLGKGAKVLLNDLAKDFQAAADSDKTHTPLFDYAEAVAVLHFGMRGCGATHDFKKTLAFLDDKPVNDCISLAQRVLLAAFGHEIPAEGDAAGNAAAPGANGSTTSPGAH